MLLIFSKSIIFVIFFIAGAIVVIQIIEVLRFYNYGRVPRTEEVNCEECLWRHTVRSGNNIVVGYCVRPRIVFSSNKCNGQCKYMRYNSIPAYPKSLINIFLEAIFAVINLVIVVLGFMLNI